MEHLVVATVVYEKLDHTTDESKPAFTRMYFTFDFKGDTTTSHALAHVGSLLRQARVQRKYPQAMVLVNSVCILEEGFDILNCDTPFESFNA